MFLLFRYLLRKWRERQATAKANVTERDRS